jgi:ABC-type dipeptide/oligopeptide/nickel transport system permease component
MPVLQLLLKRIGHSIFVLVAVALMAFLIFQFVGDPVASMVGQETSLEDRQKLRTQLGLERPVIVQFGDFVMRIATGDFAALCRRYSADPVLWCAAAYPADIRQG